MLPKQTSTTRPALHGFGGQDGIQTKRQSISRWAYRIAQACKGLQEAERGAAVVAERPAGHLCSVRSKAQASADVAPKTPRKDLQAAVLVARACAAASEAGRAVHLCTRSVAAG